jgi:hypothetical protein
MSRSDVAASCDALVILQRLAAELDRQIEARFGHQPPTAIRIQQEILKQRFEQFAVIQAQSNQQGWRIDQQMIEHELERELIVDGQPFVIQGRIDRSDHHPELGRRLLDYKTSEAAKQPRGTHVKRDGTWIDLQLPLYHFLAGGLGWTGTVSEGYINLPHKLADTQIALADWKEDELESAMQCAIQVIRDIRDEKFWPPTTMPRDDEFAGICMDHCMKEAPVTALETILDGDAS